MKYFIIALAVLVSTLMLFAGGDTDPDWYDNY